MRGLTSTIVLAVVLAGLAGYIYFIDAKRPAAGTEEKDRAFSAIEAEKIEELQITAADGETSRLVKGTGGWELVEPTAAEADASEATSITSNLSSLEVQRVVDEDPGDLAQYGLSPPRVDVAFRLQGEKELRHLLLGEKTPSGGDLYAKLQHENQVFLVASYLDSTFNRTPFDLRDKTILKFDRDKIDAVEITRAGSTIQFTKSGTDWKVAKPTAARGDFGVIEGLVSRLSSGRMQRIVDADPADLGRYGLARPAVTATVSAGSARASLALGRSEDGATYAKDAARAMVFAVEDSLAEELKKDAAEFRRKDVFDFRSFNASRIEITRGGDTVVFEKAQDQEGKEIWRNAAGQDADATKVQDLLTKLSNLRATSFEQSRPAGLTMPQLAVTVRFDEGKTETVQFGTAAERVFASRADEAGLASLEATPYQDAIAALDALS